MKIRAKINCNGVGYEHFNEGEVRDVAKEIAKVLIDYNYAEQVIEEEKKGKKTAEKAVK